MADVKGFDEILATPGLSEDTRALIQAMRAQAANQSAQIQLMRVIYHEMIGGLSMLALTRSRGIHDPEFQERVLEYMQTVTLKLQAFADSKEPTDPPA